MKSVSMLTAPVMAVMISMAAHGVATPPVPGRDIPPIGSQIVWPNDADLDRYLDVLTETGVRMARFDLCWWGLTEQTPGEYDFQPEYEGMVWDTDAMMRKLRERNMEPFPILCYTNKLYDDEFGPHTDEAREAFAAYAHAAVSRYRDEVFFWEIWNEPNIPPFWVPAPGREELRAEDYAALVKATAPRIREANPEAVIAGAATSGIPLPFLQKIIDEGVLEHIDVVTIHPYREQSPESIADEVAELREMIDKATDRPIKIWTGEWGYNTFWRSTSEEGQAKALARMMVNNLTLGIENSIWFSVHPFPEASGEEINDPEWGLVDYEFRRRPSYHAMRTANERLAAPVRFIEEAPVETTWLTVPAGMHQVWLERDESRYTLAAWLPVWPTRDGYGARPAAVTLDVPSDTRIVAYDGLSGEEVILQSAEAEAGGLLVRFSVPDYPVYLEMTLPATE